MINEDGILTIIVPVYNSEKYLRATVESLINQKTDYGYSIIAINDGSTDNSRNILSEYERKISFFKVIDQENRGLGATRNKGIDVAKTKYIYFCDSDDMVTENFIEQTISIMETENLDVLLFSGERFYDTDENNNFKPDYKRPSIEVNTGERLISEYYKKKSITVQSGLYVTRLENVRKKNLYFPTKVLFEDNYFAIQNFLIATRIKSISDVYYKRRIRPGSIMTSKNVEKKFYSYCVLMNLFFELYTDNKESKFYYAPFFNNFLSNLEELRLNMKQNKYYQLYKQAKKDYIEVYGVIRFSTIKIKKNIKFLIGLIKNHKRILF